MSECDYCKREMDYDTIILEFGYASNLDGQKLMFCSDVCLYLWVKGMDLQ